MGDHNYTKDLSFRIDRNGNMILESGIDHINHVVIRLFGMSKGMDEYNPDMGLDLRAKVFSATEKHTRDSEYESEIVKQFTAYSDLVPANVIAIYRDGTLTINMTIMYQGEYYVMDMSGSMSDPVGSFSDIHVNTNKLNEANMHALFQ